jgi:biopolymer transport protein ExbD
MKYLLFVCLVAMCIGTVMHTAFRQSVAHAQTRTLQKGVSVEMATANHAQPWPKADDNDAWVVTVDESGRLYFGSDPMKLEELKRWMIAHPRRRDQRLYIKADARAPYASVERALDAASAADFAEPVLLVNQPDASAKPGTVGPPKGLEVAVDGSNPNAQAIVIEVGSANDPTTLTLNHEPILWDSLQEKLRASVESGNEKSVFVQADGHAAFAQIARVVDACGGIKAKAVLSAATL